MSRTNGTDNRSWHLHCRVSVPGFAQQRAGALQGAALPTT